MYIKRLTDLKNGFKYTYTPKNRFTKYPITKLINAIPILKETLKKPAG